jgi:hypothetical protein
MSADDLQASRNLHGMRIPAVSLEQARHIASRFDLPGEADAFEFPEKGNINRETFLIVAGHPGDRCEYLLQLLNPDVFTQPKAVMEAMVSCIHAQQKALSAGILREGEEWEPVRLIPTRAGGTYLEALDETGPKCWRMMRKIRDTCSYKSLREIPDMAGRLRVAEQAGRGLALFGILTESMDASAIGCPLPGYRDTHLYYDQLTSVLAGSRTSRDAAAWLPADPVLQQSTGPHFLLHILPEEYQNRLEDAQIRRLVAIALEQKPFAFTLLDKLRSGYLRKVAIHGDTKLDNFLFSTRTGRVKALVDLDTIMPHTWLTDWGDLVRSLVNISGESERNPARIEVDLEVFKALARGFLDPARPKVMREMDLMVEAAQVMALELGVRFLTDYLRGDSYFRLSPVEPPDLNKVRAIVQFSVFEKLRDQADSAKRYIEELGRREARRFQEEAGSNGNA